MQEAFVIWRREGGQVAFAVDWGVGHTPRGNVGWEATFVWLVEVANLRYPRPTVPSKVPGAGWPNLIALSDQSGWLGDRPQFISATQPNVTSAFTVVRPYTSYAGSVTNASWLPNETCARMYRALTSTDGAMYDAPPRQSPLRIVSPAQFADPVPAGQPVTIELDPRNFDDTNALASVEFYDGATLLGTDTAGPEWSLTFVPQSAGLHTLNVVATDTLGRQRAAFRALYVVPADYPPIGQNQNVTLTAGTTATGTVTAFDAEGDPMTFALRQVPANGRVEFNPVTGGFIFQPAHGYVGTDAFEFVPISGGQTGTPATVTFTVHPAADANHNGLPDDWESQYSVSDPNGDDDGDGVTNLQEYRALTHPRSAADHLRLIASTASRTNSIRWAAKGGVRYRVQYSQDLKTWVDVVRPVSEEIQAGAYGAAGVAEWRDASLIGGIVTTQRFYRVRIP